MWSKDATECESYQLGYNLSNAYGDKLQYLVGDFRGYLAESTAG